MCSLHMDASSWEDEGRRLGSISKSQVKSQTHLRFGSALTRLSWSPHCLELRADIAIPGSDAENDGSNLSDGSVSESFSP